MDYALRPYLESRFLADQIDSYESIHVFETTAATLRLSYTYTLTRLISFLIVFIQVLNLQKDDLLLLDRSDSQFSNS